MNRVRWLLLWLWLGAASASAAEPPLEQRRAQMNCGNTVITAQAACHPATGACLREALTFRRIEGSTTVAPHKRLVPHNLPGGSRVEALDYHVTRWSCVHGVNGGRYVALIAARAAGGDCSLCEYMRLYHPSGQLIAATLNFDGEGRPRADEKATELIGKLIAKPAPGAFAPVYGN